MLVSTPRWKKTRTSALGMAQIGTLPLRVLGQLTFERPPAAWQGAC
jgi:hypothetical protein